VPLVLDRAMLFAPVGSLHAALRASRVTAQLNYHRTLKLTR